MEPKQIGWSQEAILLHRISKELEVLAGLIGGSASVVVTAAITTDPIELNPANFTAWNNGPGNIDTNTSFGQLAFAANTTGSTNTAYGYQAMRLNTTGALNTAVGANALRTNVSGQQNTAVGVQALELSTGTANTGVGALALSRTTGTNNTSVGTNAGKGITTGLQNTAVGYNAIGGVNGQNTTGNSNIVLGYQAGGALTTGTGNILIENIPDGVTTGITSGNFNIILNGVNFSGITTGSNNVIIGGVTGLAAALDSNVIIATGNGVRRLAFDNVGQMTISNTQSFGTGVTTEKLLVRDTAAGAVKTLDYIAIDNAITTARTAAQLTASFGTARTGFRALYLAITPNPIQYTKTATGWISTTLTNVV